MTRLRRRASAAAAALGVVAIVVAGATVAMSADAAPLDLSPSLHGAIETKAFTGGTSLPPFVPKLGSLLLDPGPAYAYATVDRDQFAGGAVSHTMTARGANLDPGAIAAAAFWVAPDCTGPDAPNAPCILSGQVGTKVDTGLEYAKGWPGYAEALFPDQPGAPSQQRVYKCVVNKDGFGAAPTQGQAQSVCKSGGTAVPVTSWAEAIGEEVRATGFSRTAGLEIPGVLSIGGSESLGEVLPEKGGLLRSHGYSTLSSISLLGGQITIDAVRASGEILASPSGAKSRSASCTFSGLTVAGQKVMQTSGGELPATQLKPLLDQVFAATQIKVEILPPKATRIATVEGGKHVAECAGIQVNLIDTRPQLVPFCTSGGNCVPPLGVREELLFGKMSVLESVNNFVTTATGDVTSALGSTIDNATGGIAAGGTPASTGAVDASTLPAASGTGGAAYGGTTLGSTSGGVGRATATPAAYRLEHANLGRIGAFAAGAAGALGLCIWLLIAVVSAIARGTPLRV
jgi:hypothetical protein